MPSHRSFRLRSALTSFLAAALLAGCSKPPPPADPGHAVDPGDEDAPDGGHADTLPYPRPGALPPAFSPTPPPRSIIAQGTVVGIFDIAGVGAGPSRDGSAVRQALAAMGVPSEFFSRPSQLGAYGVLVLTGDLTDSSVPPSTVEKIRAALSAGAAVLTVAPRVAALEALAGIDGRAPEWPVRELQVQAGDEPLLQDLRTLAISKLALAGAQAQAPVRGYTTQEGSSVLARFEDGSAALVQKGKLYVLGLRPQYYLDLAGGLGLGFDDPYTNSHYLQGDLIPLILRGFYLAYAKDPQVRKMAPAGRRAAVILTHDCDSPFSAEVVPIFAAIEREHGVFATYLVATSAYKNGILGAVYRRPLVDGLRGLLKEGFDVGNHSFGHFLDFNKLQARIGQESAANYLPRYDNGQTQGGSIFGEVQISRGLLEEDLGTEVTSFRPGFLVTPPSYYSELQASGHRRSSARAAGFVRTNFPYQAVRIRPGGYDLYPIIEYPLALSDRGLDVTTVEQVVAQWLHVVERNQVTGAPTVLLLHPSSKAGRREALAAFLDGLKGRDLWIGDLGSFARFYEAQGF